MNETIQKKETDFVQGVFAECLENTDYKIYSVISPSGELIINIDVYSSIQKSPLMKYKIHKKNDDLYYLVMAETAEDIESGETVTDWIYSDESFEGLEMAVFTLLETCFSDEIPEKESKLRKIFSGKFSL